MGWTIASRFARLGADLAICGRDPKDAQDAQDQLANTGYGMVWGTGADMTDPTAVIDFSRQALNQLGSLDFIVMNAGGALADGSLLATADDWIRTYTLNTLQLVLLIQTTLPILRQSSQGAVVAITSISGRLAAPRAQYGASKAATRYVATEKGVSFRF